MPPQGVVVLWVGVASSQCAKQTLLQGFENGGGREGGRVTTARLCYNYRLSTVPEIYGSK